MNKQPRNNNMKGDTRAHRHLFSKHAQLNNIADREGSGVSDTR